MSSIIPPLPPPPSLSIMVSDEERMEFLHAIGYSKVRLGNFGYSNKSRRVGLYILYHDSKDKDEGVDVTVLRSDPVLNEALNDLEADGFVYTTSDNNHARCSSFESIIIDSQYDVHHLAEIVASFRPRVVDTVYLSVPTLIMDLCSLIGAYLPVLTIYDLYNTYDDQRDAFMITSETVSPVCRVVDNNDGMPTVSIAQTFVTRCVVCKRSGFDVRYCEFCNDMVCFGCAEQTKDDEPISQAYFCSDECRGITPAHRCRSCYKVFFNNLDRYVGRDEFICGQCIMP